MSAPDAAASERPLHGGRPRARLSGWLGPRTRREDRRGRVALIVLVGIGLLLSAATITDLVQRVGKDNRFTADIKTWRMVMGHNYLNLTTERGEEEDRGTTDVTCANTSAGPPGYRVQLCIILTGPILRDGLRAHPGGYYLPPHLPDKKIHRYGCYGIAVREHFCEPAR